MYDYVFNEEEKKLRREKSASIFFDRQVRTGRGF